MEQLIGQVLHDRYRIQSLLGRQTGRRTFLADDLQTGVSVVVKLLLFGPDFTWDDLKLFEREAEVLKSLDHPAIPKYLDCFEAETELGKGFALVQSYIEASSLQNWVKSGRSFSEEELQAIAKELLEILNYIHNRQPAVVHRDIKPSNILLGNRSGNSPGKVYLIDFGSVQTSVHGGTVTVVGTYGYMPPEQFGGRASPASDLYSVGATLIHLATGQHPADLPQKDLRIEFEQLTSLSSSFIHWIQWLTDPNLSKRPTSAKSTLELDFYQHLDPNTFKVASSSNTPLFLNRRSPSNIELGKTTTTLEIKLPRRQLNITSLQLFSSSFDDGSFGCLSILLFFLVIIYFALPAWIFWAVIILSCLYPSLKSPVSPPLTESYNVMFQLEGDSISVSLVSISSRKSKNLTIFSQAELKSLSAGPNLPNYQLNISCHGFDKAFYITGNRAEIQWLCDELNEWTGREIQYIQYKDSTTTV